MKGIAVKGEEKEERVQARENGMLFSCTTHQHCKLHAMMLGKNTRCPSAKIQNKDTEPNNS